MVPGSGVVCEHPRPEEGSEMSSLSGRSRSEGGARELDLAVAVPLSEGCSAVYHRVP